MYVLVFLALFLIVATLAEFIRLPYWWLRIFDFPHFQIWWLSLILIGGFLLADFRLSLFHKILLAGLIAVAAYKSYRIFPYTFLAKKKAATVIQLNDDRQLSVLIVNVLMDNRSSEKLKEQVEQYDPDILVLIEPDHWWEGEFRYLEGEHYPFTIREIIDNTYGMILYSRLELIDPSVKFMKMDTIPSIDTKVKLRNGEVVRLFSIHPLPPAPGQDTNERDSELMMFAQIIKNSEDPCIIVGDLNDVAWSRTTRLFLKETSMLDPRLGRGYYNSYNAKIPFLRYPLDHVFYTNHFKLVDLARGKAFGSDHFPIYIKVQLEPEEIGRNELPEAPDEDDREEIEKMKDDRN